jgi:thioredoxin-dependent peroxiredoxin
MATKSLTAGDVAPEIRLDTDSGEAFELSSLKGKTVVLYFYPKADTPGCTTESCDFRDNVSKFKKKGVAVIGISPDKVDKQAKFKAKYDLTFPLLADVDHKVAEDYGVWQLKKNYGKEYMGIVRSTFVIDKDGKIAKVFSKVKVAGHVDAVFEALP